MILSALLTSVGINLGLCLLYFTLYSILRKQPCNADVYAPRLVAEGKSQQRSAFNLERLFPSTSWVKRAWQPSEEELLSISGLDAIVFMRIFIFSLRVFAFAGIIGIFVLLPVNYTGNQLTVDFSDLPNKSLDSFSISNVDDGSNRLWIHFSAVYVFSAFVCYLLYFENNYIASKRIDYFYSSKPQPHHFTVLVRAIPASSESSFSETVEDFFTKYYPSSYLSHYVVHRTSKLQRLISDADKLYKRLVHIKTRKHTQKQFGRTGFLGLFGPKVDLLDHYEKKLEGLEDDVRVEQSSLAGKEVSAAYVSFKSRFSAATIFHIQQGVNPTEWVTEPAPEPHDVHWPFFSASFMKRWISNLVVVVACIGLTVLFLIPVAIVQGLTNLDQLETWFPFLTSILNIAIISQVITGYLPSLILKLFLKLVPPVMITLSSIQGYFALSQIEKSACTKVLWFTIWNIFFANVLSGTALYQVNVFLEPKKIPSILAVAVPGQVCGGELLIAEAYFLRCEMGRGNQGSYQAKVGQMKVLILNRGPKMVKGSAHATLASKSLDDDCNSGLAVGLTSLLASVFRAPLTGTMVISLFKPSSIVPFLQGSKWLPYNEVIVGSKGTAVDEGGTRPSEGASFFIAYVVTSGWTSTSSELFRLIPFISSSIKRAFCGDADDHFEVPSIPYHSEIPQIVFFGLLGITYFFLAPLILPFLLVYYCLGYIVYRNQ
ncbi:hypothetical protein RJ640_025650, partial [Escallonia rubra]